MIRKSITFFIILTAFLAVGGCAQETPATVESVLPEKPKADLPPFYQPNGGNTGSAVIQNPVYEAPKTP